MERNAIPGQGSGILIVEVSWSGSFLSKRTWGRQHTEQSNGQAKNDHVNGENDGPPDGDALVCMIEEAPGILLDRDAKFQGMMETYRETLKWKTPPTTVKPPTAKLTMRKISESSIVMCVVRSRGECRRVVWCWRRMNRK